VPKKIKRLPIVIVCISMLASTAFATDVGVTIDGVKSANGNVVVAIFDKASEFPRGKRMMSKVVPAVEGAVTVVFSDVPPGRYALSAFHDVNANGRLDTNMVGRPTEPHGASRDARGSFGPPKFEDAAVVVGADTVQLTIHLN
jgi:uncharacterized protein (DUF2141 family)